MSLSFRALSLRSLVPFFVLCGLSACDEDLPVVGDVCDAIFDLCDDGLGWTDLDACNAGFIGSLDMGTTCSDEDGYFGCVDPCLAEKDCLAFAACEGECWDTNCR